MLKCVIRQPCKRCSISQQQITCLLWPFHSLSNNILWSRDSSICLTINLFKIYVTLLGVTCPNCLNKWRLTCSPNTYSYNYKKSNTSKNKLNKPTINCIRILTSFQGGCRFSVRYRQMGSWWWRWLPIWCLNEHGHIFIN